MGPTKKDGCGGGGGGDLLFGGRGLNIGRRVKKKAVLLGERNDLTRPHPK